MAADGERSRGPRGADADTRADIRAAALTLFARDGYDATSLRAIAREADVDPSLVRHYFDSKEELFVAAMGPLEKIVENVDSIAQAPTEEVGERVVRAFLGVWGSEEFGPRLRAVLTTAILHPAIADAAKAQVLERLFVGIAEAHAIDRIEERAVGAASQMIGLALSRYVLKMQPIASATDEEIVAQYGPVVQRHLTGEL